MAAIYTQKPVAAALGEHHLEVSVFNAVRTSNILRLSYLWPLNHGPPALPGTEDSATKRRASDSGQGLYLYLTEW